jgi:predicted permease
VLHPCSHVFNTRHQPGEHGAMPMIVALLIVIILILLFGAAAVKGWIKSAIAGIAGFAVICTAIIWLGSFFGEDGPAYVLLGIAGVMIALGALGFILTEIEKAKANRRGRRDEIRRKPKIERLWHHFAKDIERFDPDAKDMARRYYDAKNVQGLREFCRAEIARLNGPGGSPAR